MFNFIIFSILLKTALFPDSLFESGKSIFMEKINAFSHLKNYEDSFELFFEKIFESEKDFWIEGTIYIKKRDFKISKIVSGYSEKNIFEAMDKFVENSLIYLNTIFSDPPFIEKVEKNKVIISKGFLSGINVNESFAYGDIESPSGYIKIEKIYDNSGIGKIFIKERIPEKGEKVFKVKGIPYIYSLYLTPSLLVLSAKKGGYGEEERIKDGLIYLYGLGFRFKIHAPFSPLYFIPGLSFNTSTNLETQKLSLLSEYLLNNFISLGISLDILLIWQKERFGKEVRGIDYLLVPVISFNKNFEKLSISLKTGYSLGRIIRNFAFEKIGGDTLVPSENLLFKEVDPKGFNFEFLIGIDIKKP